MKVLVISDTHHNIANAVKIIETIKKIGLKHIIHCGDYIDDAERLKKMYPDIEMHAVYGNCDKVHGDAESQVICIDKVAIFITHGHKHGVKWGDYETLFIDASAHSVQLAICGHSHCAYLEKKQGIILLNPGSISSPRDFPYPSYGMLDIEKGIIRNAAVMQLGSGGIIAAHPVSSTFINS